MEKVNTLAGAEKIVLLSQQVHPLGRGWGEAGPKSPHQETRTIRPRIAASQQAPERTRHCPSLHPQLCPNAPCPSFQAQSTPLSRSPRATVTFPRLQAPASPAGPHRKPPRVITALPPAPHVPSSWHCPQPFQHQLPSQPAPFPARGGSWCCPQKEQPHPGEEPGAPRGSSENLALLRSSSLPTR